MSKQVILATGAVAASQSVDGPFASSRPRVVVRLATSLLAAASVLAAAGSPAAEQPFDYFRNSWTVIGLKDYEHGTRVSPENELVLADGQRLRFRIGPDGRSLSREQTKTLLDGWLPIVLLAAEDGGVRYQFKFWATPLPTVKDWQAAFNWPTEGENYLNWVWVRATNTGDRPAEAKVQAERVGKRSGQRSEFAWKLAPGQSAEAVLRVPYESSDTAAFADAAPRLWLDRTVQFWRRLLASGARIEVPDSKATDALRASHVYQFINNDHGVVQGGEGFYDIFYIRDGAYEVMQFEEAGFLDTARRAMNAYLAAQRPDGRFETQKGQLDANGQALWTLWQFYQITGDRPWLQRAYPQMVRAVQWLMAARRQAPADSPFAGLLPNAVADGEHLWNGQYHIVGYDFWNLRGLLCTAAAARVLGREDDANRFEKEAKAYRAAIDAAWQRTGLPHFPPSWEKAGTHWGDTETLWPTAIFDRDDPRVAALIDQVRHRFGGGFCEGTIRWSPGTGRSAIHPYMSAYTTMASLRRDEHEQVVQDFYWYLLHSTATHAFPEGIYWRRRFAWSHTIPHATGASNYACMLRHMLVDERGQELHLLPAVPDWWLADGRQIVVERAPTHFGLLSFSVRGAPDGVQVALEPPQRRRPQRIVLHLPRSRPPQKLPDGISLQLRADQSRRWDLTTVIAAYEQIKPQPLPGLLKLPLEKRPRPDDCRLLDLTRLANTDPFAAPFGVPHPGKFLFVKLPVGRQVVGGVPFHIIDPAANGGRGLIVLQGGQGNLAATRFPRQVEIPVGQTGTRVFFLGNVLGWSGGDAGAGYLGTVAEYVIQYADGQRQRIPLIPGRTADDWAVPPVADQVQVALSGNPWHLNLLAAPLRPVRIDHIIFRDLGTVSSPVLVAVTIESGEGQQ